MPVDGDGRTVDNPISCPHMLPFDLASLQCRSLAMLRVVDMALLLFTLMAQEYFTSEINVRVLFPSLA